MLGLTLKLAFTAALKKSVIPASSLREWLDNNPRIIYGFADLKTRQSGETPAGKSEPSFFSQKNLSFNLRA